MPPAPVEPNTLSPGLNALTPSPTACTAEHTVVEAAELMRFQQAYSGATKIIQVARETLQSIIDLF